MAKIVIDTELNTKSFDRQIQKLKTDIERYMRVLESDAKVPVKFQMSASERQEIETTIEKLRNQLVSLQEQAKKTGEVGEVAGEQSGRGFDRGITSLKRFALGLFGVRSAFMVIRKATNAYLSENETTANKMNAIWVALGNALGPIIELIANGVLKLIGYLNVFLNALGFKIDLTKNIGKNTKAIKNQTKAMKELNNQVASFDEMNVAQKETSSGGGGTSPTSDAFEMPELNENIVKFLQDTAKWLKENWQLLALIGGVIAGFKVAKWLSGLASLIGGGTGASAKGLLGLSSILKGLLAMEVIAITISVIYYGKQLNDLKKLNKELEKMYENNTKGIDEVNKKNLESVKSYEKGSKAIDDYVYEMQQEVEQAKTQIETKKRQNEEMSNADKIWDAFGKTGEKNNKIIMENTQRLINNATNLQQLAKEGKLTDEQMKIYNQTMDYLNKTQDELGGFLNDNKTNMMMFGTSVYETEIDLYNQIDALKKAEATTTNTTNSQKTAYGSLREKVQTEMNRINNLYARPTVDIQVKTNKLSSTLDAIQNSSFLAGLGLTKGLSTTISKLRSIGMARGGIVYNPGRGVPLSNIFTGEATGGAEGIIPMNNEQSMDLIGQSIARHLVVNLTNTTMLDSKVIAREQRRIEDENNFATNGRGVL